MPCGSREWWCDVHLHAMHLGVHHAPAREAFSIRRPGKFDAGGGLQQMVSRCSHAVNLKGGEDMPLDCGAHRQPHTVRSKHSLGGGTLRDPFRAA